MNATKHLVQVSPEMLSCVGAGHLPQTGWPEDAVLIAFYDGAVPVLSVDPAPDDSASVVDAGLVFLVAGDALDRLFGARPHANSWHLPSALRVLMLAIREPAVGGAAGDTMRLAKSIELLCALFDHLGRDLLVPVDEDGALSERDATRIVAARRLVDERWHEKLSLDVIARACGLNRGKLTRGFRAVYGCTIADALTERRLSGAQHMLAATDLPVATIGFRCGYLNNASFARAFTRHTGVAPTRWRALGVVA